jgi:hypothetical protein
MKFLVNRLAIRWFQRKGELYKARRVWQGLRAQSRNLGGRCLKWYRQGTEGDGNAVLTLFQRRVLLEMLDQKQPLYLS